jgi:general secretion pathway protein H
LHRRTRFPGGFTLLELLVVLTIAGLLAALVPPLYAQVVPGAKLKTAAREFAIALREARGNAISRGSQVDLRLLTEPASYTLGSASNIQLPRDVIVTAYDYFTAAHTSLADSNALGDEDIVVRFFPDGSSNGAVIKLANGDTAYRVDVSWLLGDIRVSRVGDHAP